LIINNHDKSFIFAFTFHNLYNNIIIKEVEIILNVAVDLPTSYKKLYLKNFINWSLNLYNYRLRRLRRGTFNIGKFVQLLLRIKYQSDYSTLGLIQKVNKRIKK